MHARELNAIEIALTFPISPTEEFVINNNFFEGTLPDVFDAFDRLETMDVISNSLTGTIPASLFDVPTLRLVYLSNNTFTGMIPPTYSRPPQLRYLYLDGNGLTGAIPPLLQPNDLQDLNEFLLQNNFLTGSVPWSICALRGDAGDLDDLFVDCAGDNPRVECIFPACCNRCFESSSAAR